MCVQEEGVFTCKAFIFDLMYFVHERHIFSSSIFFIFPFFKICVYVTAGLNGDEPIFDDFPSRLMTFFFVGVAGFGATNFIFPTKMLYVFWFAECVFFYYLFRVCC